MSENSKPKHRFGMLIDLDRCNGCGACMVACAAENNVAPAAARAGSRNGVTPLRVFRMTNQQPFPAHRSVFVPMMCQQCGKDAPCVSVCPQQAVEQDPDTGIVGQIPERCFGCRYCMAACPYQARYFNWWDPTWPEGMEKTLNPSVSPRMRGVVEKCNLCHGRWHAAQAKTDATGEPLNPADYVPACVEACPTRAILFGDLADAESEISRFLRSHRTARFLESLGTDPGVYYFSRQDWVMRMVRGAKEFRNA